MSDAGEYEAARHARAAMHDVWAAFVRLRRLRRDEAGEAERALLEAMRAAISEANEALGLDVVAAMPGPSDEEVEEARRQADEDAREAVWS